MNTYLEGVIRKGLAATQLTDVEKSMAVERYRHEISLILPNREKTEAIFYMILLIVTTTAILFLLAELTAPHAVRSRYPMPDEGFDPLQYYTRDRGIVAYLPEIHLFAHKAIEQTDELYDLLATADSEYNRDKTDTKHLTKQSGGKRS